MGSLAVSVPVLVLGVGSEVSDLKPGDVVLVVSAKTVELRDGSKLVRRQHAVARVRDRE